MPYLLKLELFGLDFFQLLLASLLFRPHFEHLRGLAYKTELSATVGKGGALESVASGPRDESPKPSPMAVRLAVGLPLRSLHCKGHSPL